MKIRRIKPKCYEVEVSGMNDDGCLASWRIQVRLDDLFMPWFGIVVEPPAGSDAQSPEGYGGNVSVSECLAIAGLLLAASAHGLLDDVKWYASRVHGFIEGVLQRARDRARVQATHQSVWLDARLLRLLRRQLDASTPSPRSP